MTPERQQKINRVFEEALELEGAKRESYLAKECAGDDDLRVEVDRLLKSDQKNMEDPLDPKRVFHESLLDGRYKIIRVLGEGGYGRVYLAEHTELQRPVAVKFLSIRPDLGADQVSRFKQEARAALDVDHKNVVRISDLETEGPAPYLVSEYVDGETLQQKLLNGPIAELEALKIAQGIADALAAAHEIGVVHRDIKPANVMIRKDGVVKVLDFGIAKLLRRPTDSDSEATTRHLTAQGVVFGTELYMSPEHKHGLEIDERADLWSLGVVLHEMLYGHVPGMATSNSRPSGRVRNIVEKALALDIDQRYQTAAEFRAALDRVLESNKAVKVIEELEDGAQRSQIPLPDLPKHRGVIVPLPAISLSQTDGYDSIPFDVGTMWGLDRSSFIGVLPGVEGERIYGAMQRVERLLVDVKASHNLELPTRWWLKVAPLRYPNGPFSLDDIRKSLADETDERVQYLMSTGFPANVIPGFFFETHTNETGDDDTVMLLNWCSELFTKVELPQIAVLINVIDKDIEKAHQKASGLLRKISEMKLEVPAELVLLNEAIHVEAKAAETSNPLSSAQGPVGFHFRSWVSAALRNAGDEWRESQEREYRALIAEIARWQVSDEDLAAESSARQVVVDLEKMAKAETDGSNYRTKELVGQFLSLVKRYLPTRTHSLVKEFATSSLVAMRTALAFSSQSDSLMDAWVDGYCEHRKHKLAVKDLKPQNEPAFINDFVLGLLRRYVGGKNRDEVRDEINNLRRVLTPQLREVCSLCFGEMNADEFFKSLAFEKIMFALRAGIDFKPESLNLAKVNLNTPEAWWLQTGLPMTRNRLLNWLNLDAPRRAVFGLSTVSEWRHLKDDREVVRQLNTCRRGRPLYFNSLSH
jgi:serine/threonine protein kinase